MKPTCTERIPWAKPCLWGDEAGLLQEAIASTWISGGPFVDRLEEDLCRYLRSPHGLAVSNGTTAIHLAYLALDIKPGDEVIVPGFGFLAAANIALHMGARPVFCDVDPRTWIVRAEDIEPCITPRTRAVVVIHTYGNIGPMDAIMDLAEHHGLAVIEDAAEAFGGNYKGRPAGTFGDIGTFSFQATKTITTGEGGLVVTRQPELNARMALYRSHGMQRKVPYWHDVPGHNFRLTNLQAAIGLAQLRHLSAIERERRRIDRTYRRASETLEGITWQYFPPDVTPVVWAMALKLHPDAYPQGRDAVIAAMAAEGIETRPGFYTPSRHDYFAAPELPVSDRVSRQVICLPMFVELSDRQIQAIVKILARLKR